MGGKPKGWLLAPQASEPRVSVIERTVALARERCGEVVLVGRADPYAALGVESIPDASTAQGESARGPLAGLVALLEHAGGGAVIALACDMPYLTREMLARLVGFAPDAAAVAPRAAVGKAPWSPLFARYDVGRVRGVARAMLEAGERSLRAVLDAVGTTELACSPEEHHALRDWDTPADVEVAQ
jgi:molybdopterin-guanine dinucleotide biosynthesis protein A